MGIIIIIILLLYTLTYYYIYLHSAYNQPLTVPVAKVQNAQVFEINNLHRHKASTTYNAKYYLHNGQTGGAKYLLGNGQKVFPEQGMVALAEYD